jgi:phosphonate transport system substrate-binding protein
MRRFLILVVLAASSSMGSAAAAAQDSSPAYTFAVVPQRMPTEVAREWAPIVRAVAERTGLRLAFQTAPDIPEFERRLQAGLYDFALMNPYHYVSVAGPGGFRALVRERAGPLVGVIVARAVDGPATLRDLSGQPIAFPAPAAFAASILTQLELVAAGVVCEPRYVRSHDSVYLSVAQGRFVAGGGVEATFDAVAPEIRAQLRVLHRTAPFKPHPLAAHARVGAETAGKVENAMLSLETTAPELLRNAHWAGVELARDADYDPVRRLVELQPVAPFAAQR